MRNKIFITLLCALGMWGGQISSGEESYTSQAEKDLQALEQELLGDAMNEVDETEKRQQPAQVYDQEIGVSEEFLKAVENLTPLEDKEDIHAFTAKLKALATPRSRGIRIRVLQDAQKRPFEQLSSNEANLSRTWYDAPKVVISVQPEWVKYYVEAVAPKIDAFFRPLATSVYEASNAVKLYQSDDEGTYIDWRSVSSSNQFKNIPKNCCYYCLHIPERLNEYEPEYKGDEIHIRTVVYCLPNPYHANISNSQHESVYWHVYDKDHKHLCTIDNSKSYGYDGTWSVIVGDTGRIPGCSFSWLLGNHISYPVFRRAWCYMKEGDTYGGSLVTFRPAEECFPELKKSQNSGDATSSELQNLEKQVEKDRAEAPVEEVSFFEDLINHFVLYTFIFLLIVSVPYMIVTLIVEAFQRYLSLDLPEDYDRAADDGTELRAEVRELIDIYNSLPKAKQNESEEVLPVFVDRKQAKAFTKQLVATASLPDLTNAEKYELNRLGRLRNELCTRAVCGSTRLFIISIIYAIGVWYFFDSYMFFAIPVYYMLTLMCPTYILAHGEPKLLTGIRNMMRGIAFVSSIFAANAASQRFATVYTDGRGNFFTNTDEGVAHLGIAIGVLIVVLIFLPLLILADGLCNFFRNYVLSK